ncbi:argonaute PAZ domain-containing protein [Parathermosynechococcus lividus]
MTSSGNSYPVILNQFCVKTLEEEARLLYPFTCRWQQNPELGTEAYALNKVCCQLPVPAARWGSAIVTRQPPEQLETEAWQLVPQPPRVFDCTRLEDREALESLCRQELYRYFKQRDREDVDRGSNNSIRIWERKPSESPAQGWTVHQGFCLDVRLDATAKLYLEIDCFHHFSTPLTLQEWLNTYPEYVPLIKWVRNTYLKNNQFLSWQLHRISDERPEAVNLPRFNISLAEYHRNEGATEQELSMSQVVYLKSAQGGQPILHLSQRLRPSVTLEMLAELGRQRNYAKEVEKIFTNIRLSSSKRFQKSTAFATWLRINLYGGSADSIAPVTKEGHQLPPAILLAKDNRQVKKVADVRKHGCAQIGETKFGLLNLITNEGAYPEEIRKCLQQIARHHGIELDLSSYRTSADLGESDLARQRFWQAWADEGVRTVLVVMPYSHQKQRIRNEALRANIATQFAVPDQQNDYKAMNVVLGLLCKAKWQPVHLQPLDDVEKAELIVGFDTGTNRFLYFGTPAFAVLANGQSLGWELPMVQRGEKISGEAVWQTILKLMGKFYTICGRYPSKVLLMRDGLARPDEFERTIQELKRESIAVDLLSVRKSGAGRMACPSNGIYQSAPKGTVVYDDTERSFLLITSQPIKRGKQELGSTRPLRIVHTYGSTPLELLALQTYHLAQLHPASGYSHARLPWVLHFAHKSSQEFSRIEPLSILEGLDRDKLIAV